MTTAIDAPQASILFNHYLELRKMRELRLKQLQVQQKHVQHHERSLFKIKNRLAHVLTELAQVKSKLNQLIDSNIWVTALEHEKIHAVYEKINQEYSEWCELKKKRHFEIEKEAQRAKVHASHIIGIERALACLEDQMRKQFPHYNSSNKEKRSNRSYSNDSISKNNAGSIVPKDDAELLLLNRIYLRKSPSQCTFSSIVTADSKNSTSLSGTLLKKWLKPMMAQQQQQQNKPRMAEDVVLSI